MDKTLEERIRLAVEQGTVARREYFDAIGLLDEQELGHPATEVAVIALEERLGRPLPPSYRVFLRLYNGWKMIDGGIDLFAVEDLLGGPQLKKIQTWQQQMLAAGDDVAARSLVIGVSDIAPTKYLLDPAVVTDDGEWRLVQHHKVEEDEFPSFLEWLEESVDEYRELARIARERAPDEEDE